MIRIRSLCPGISDIAKGIDKLVAKVLELA